MLYGRLYLPTSTLEALYQRRLTPTRLLTLSCVSSSRLKSGGTLLAHHTQDTGLYTVETLLSTDSLLLGLRGLYNFGEPFAPSSSSYPPSSPAASLSSSSSSPPTGPPPTTRLSAGGELYYGLLNSTIGLSTGLRLSTLPSHPSFPLTMTLTANPLMGALSCTYAVRATPGLALASRFDFNAYSYESGVVLGCELWRRGGAARDGAHAWAERKMGLSGGEDARGRDATAADDGVQGVLKARVDQSGCVSLLWEGRVKELLFSLGAAFDLRRRDQPFRSVGVEMQYSS